MKKSCQELQISEFDIPMPTRAVPVPAAADHDPLLRPSLPERVRAAQAKLTHTGFKMDLKQIIIDFAECRLRKDELSARKDSLIDTHQGIFAQDQFKDSNVIELLETLFEKLKTRNKNETQIALNQLCGALSIEPFDVPTMQPFGAATMIGGNQSGGKIDLKSVKLKPAAKPNGKPVATITSMMDPTLAQRLKEQKSKIQ